MSTKTIIQTVSLAILLCGFTVTAKSISPSVTTQPNEFYFTRDVYYVQRGATNAMIEVAFVPGSSSYSGSVDYRTANGTATAGQDYVGVTNTLSFSGLAPSKTFSVSIKVNAQSQGDETVLLALSNPSAFITRSNATLVIVDPPAQAKLDLVRANGTVTVSWPSTFTNCVLQKATSLGGEANWTDMTQAATVSGGRYSHTMASTGNAFFRLKQTTP